ncbi:hypothetical protein C8Q77DRAFT_821832 [Trametes polyzona]|nr:hypothetical protein C8Q77DRAFT_821832 [Trametes polyzona]
MVMDEATRPGMRLECLHESWERTYVGGGSWDEWHRRVPGACIPVGACWACQERIEGFVCHMGGVQDLDAQRAREAAFLDVVVAVRGTMVRAVWVGHGCVRGHIWAAAC